GRRRPPARRESRQRPRPATARGKRSDKGPPRWRVGLTLARRASEGGQLDRPRRGKSRAGAFAISRPRAKPFQRPAFSRLCGLCCAARLYRKVQACRFFRPIPFLSGSERDDGALLHRENHERRLLQARALLFWEGEAIMRSWWIGGALTVGWL